MNTMNDNDKTKEELIKEVAALRLQITELVKRTADQEKIRIEKALQESEAKYCRLVESLPDILYTYSVQRGGIYYSPQVEKVLGYTVEHLRNHPSLWHDSISPEELPAVEQAIQKSAIGQRIELEYRIRDAYGKWHWFHDRSVSITNEADEILINGIATDITDRKRDEEAMRRREKKTIATSSIQPQTGFGRSRRWRESLHRTANMTVYGRISG